MVSRWSLLPVRTRHSFIIGLKEIIKACHHGALTTRSPEGHLHARAMTPASYEGLQFLFLANNASYKFDEIQADSNVNIAFVDAKTTNWASISGTASVSQDKDLIKKLWSP